MTKKIVAISRSKEHGVSLAPPKKESLPIDLISEGLRIGMTSLADVLTSKRQITKESMLRLVSLFRQPYTSSPQVTSQYYSSSIELSRIWEQGLVELVSANPELTPQDIGAIAAVTASIPNKPTTHSDVEKKRQMVTGIVGRILEEKQTNTLHEHTLTPFNDVLPMWVGDADGSIAHQGVPFLHGHDNHLCEATVGSWFSALQDYQVNNLS